MSEINTWPGWKNLSQIGKGSYGRVYAISTKENGEIRKAALKVMSIPTEPEDIQTIFDQSLANTEQEAKKYIESQIDFVSQEYRMMASLQGNPNIVRYEDHMIIPHDGWLGADVLIRMELLTPFTKYIRNSTKKTLDEVGTVRMGIDIAHALEACHNHVPSILHRDVKAANIMIDENGTFKLGDFGVARVMEGTKSAHTTAGTEDYMAPEVLSPNSSYYATADIYSLGILLYRQLNNNRNPFLPTNGVLTVENHATAKKRRTSGAEIPPPLYGSDELKKVVQKSLAFKPEDRYRSAYEFRLALEACPEAEELDEEGTILEKKPAPVQDDPTTGNVSADAETETMKPEPDNGDKGTVVEYQNDQHDDTEELENGADEEMEQDTGDEQDDPHDPGTVFGIIPSETQGSPKKQIAPIIAAVLALLLACGGGGGYYFTTTTAVPTVSGMAFETASSQLIDAGFAVEKEIAYSDTVKRDYVISADREGKRATKGTTINLTVSDGRLIIVPKVVGMDYADAKEQLETAGMAVVLEEEYSDEKAANTVIAQSLAEGKKAEENDPITLKVSKGSKPFSIDNYADMPIDEAKSSAEKLGLEVKTKEEFHSSVTKGNIIKQEPEEETEVTKGNTVTFWVSKGVEQVDVPDLTGLTTESEISNALEAVGLKLDASYEYSKSVEKGHAISFETPSTRDKGSSYSVVFSLGDNTTTVPSLVGKSKDAAESALKNAGLKMSSSNKYSNSVAKGKVISQSKSAGASVEKGTTVNVVISKGKQSKSNGVIDIDW